uniref:DNA polymerase epsilon catalytic subunit n=2 Tax=Lygus hesperus TaxID=30085 RepID=A0A146L8J6_LYGHE
MQQPVVTQPKIYHLDVSAMYPNIILTNRLQPYAMVSSSTCGACEYYSPDNSNRCQRVMEWAWRGKVYNASEGEVNRIRLQLREKGVGGWSDEHASQLHKHVSLYSRRVHKRATEERVEIRKATVCQREHPFYINTVESFRNRRYEYKDLHKYWYSRLQSCKDEGERNHCNTMI